MIYIHSDLPQLADKVSSIPNDVSAAFSSTAEQVSYVIENELNSNYSNTFIEASVDVYYDGNTITVDIMNFNEYHLMNASGLTIEEVKDILVDLIDEALAQNLNSIGFFS
jgi:hypothetical protein